MAKLIDASSFFPEKLKGNELNIKASEILDFLMTQAFTDLDDTRLKFRGPDQVTIEVIQEILFELGFEDLSNLLTASQNIDPNAILAFSAMIFLLKGHRDGLEMVLNLLGFSFTIEEWWEQVPKAVPDTFLLEIVLDTSQVSDIFGTINNLQKFIQGYVYPILDPLILVISYQVAEINVNVAGFPDKEVQGTTPGTFPINGIAGFTDKEVTGSIVEP
jgi:hypothetical protein